MISRSEKKKNEFKRFLANLGLKGFKAFAVGYRNIIVPHDCKNMYQFRFINSDKGDFPYFPYDIENLHEITNVNTFTQKSKFKKIEFWDSKYNKHEFDTYKDLKEYLVILKLSGISN